MLAPPLFGLLLAAAAPVPAVAEAPLKVLVLPPQPVGESAGLPWVGEAVADTLGRDLARLGVPVTSRSDRLRAHEVLDIPVVALTRATAIRLAEALNVGRLITGTYERHGSDLSLSLRVLDVERGTLSPPQIAKAPLEQYPAALHGLAWDIALSGPWKASGSREEFLEKTRSVPFPAFEAYGVGLGPGKASTRIEQLRRALKVDPAYDEARLALARLEIETRDHASVETVVSLVKPDSPLAREARFLQGVALLELGRYREASDLFGTLAQEEATPGVLSNQALAILRSDGNGASVLLRQAATMAPGWDDLSFNLGWALLVEGDVEAAVFWLRGVTRQAPHDVYARVALSWALKKAGRAAEAAEELRGVELMGPEYQGLDTPDLSRRLGRVLTAEQPLVIERSDVQLAAAHVGRADAMLKANDSEGALRELTRAAYLDPYSARAHELMARAHISRGEKEKAVNELQMSLWCREDAAVRIELARTLLDLGRAGQAQAEAEKVLRSDPGNEDARAVAQAAAAKAEPAP